MHSCSHIKEEEGGREGGGEGGREARRRWEAASCFSVLFSLTKRGEEQRVEKRKRTRRRRGEEKVNDGCLTKSRLFLSNSTGPETRKRERVSEREKERKHRKVAGIPHQEGIGSQ